MQQRHKLRRELRFIRPKFVQDIFIHQQNRRILYLNSAAPDWITINEKYKAIFDCFDGSYLPEEIAVFIKSNLPDEHHILIPQIFNLINTSNIFDHNFVTKNTPSDTVENKPKYIYLTLTDRCNLNCIYCYAKERKLNDDADFEKWELYINSILEFVSNPVFIFTGGEPLVLSYIYKIATLTKSHGCENILLTNGTNINSVKTAIKISGLFSLIKISLDTLDEEISTKLRGIDTKKKAVNAFNLLKKCNANVQILATVTALTKENIDEFSNFFDQNVNFQPFYNMGLGRENSRLYISGEEYYHALTQTNIFRLLPGFHKNIHNYRNRPFVRCAMANEEISIDSAGNVFPCHMLHYTELNCGNINIESFKDIYSNSPILKRLRNINVETIKQCKVCTYRNFCGGSCRARVDFKNNGIDGSNNFCEFEKRAIFDALLYSYG